MDPEFYLKAVEKNTGNSIWSSHGILGLKELDNFLRSPTNIYPYEITVEALQSFGESLNILPECKEKKCELCEDDEEHERHHIIFEIISRAIKYGIEGYIILGNST